MENTLKARTYYTASENCDLKARAWRRQAFREKKIEYLGWADQTERLGTRFRKTAEEILKGGKKNGRKST